MSGAILFDHNGLRVRLGDELGRGGEATVFALPDQPRFVAKLYHQRPDHDKAQKLLKMVAIQNERLLNLAAWPVVVLRTKVDGDVAGFAMPNVSGLKDVHLLYSPRSRAKDFPANIGWGFLVHAAANIARAFAVVHEQGHAIGDVNERNLKVSPTSAVVNLIDCDSFQIRTEDRYFLCEVGVPPFTPSELQEKNFKTVVRTPNHDNFGLAVLIFHLLFMGRHPFAGRFQGKGDMPIEKAIYEHRFAYSPDNQLTRMQPPPNTLELSQISPAVAELFLRAFSANGVNNGRPTASSWVSALASLEADLKKCGTNPAHQFYGALSQCPWCSIEGRTGVVLFVGIVSYESASGFRLDIVWGRIQGIPRPGAAVLPDFSQLRGQFKPVVEAARAGRKRRVGFGVILIGVFFVIGGSFALGLGSGVVWIALIALGIAWSSWGRMGKDRERYVADRRVAEKKLRSIQDRWRTEATDEKFQQKLAYLGDLKSQHVELPKLHKLKLGQLQNNLRQSQLQAYLDKFTIAAATIPNIGSGRKAMLASYGIDTAADVSMTAIDAVPGFGQFLTGNLLDWRHLLENKFVFNPNRGIDAEDIRKLDQEITGKRTILEASLLNGAAELLSISSQTLAARRGLAQELEHATRELYQTEANACAA